MVHGLVFVMNHMNCIILKNKKSDGIINIYTSIIFDTFALELRICTDAGRLTRPYER